MILVWINYSTGDCRMMFNIFKISFCCCFLYHNGHIKFLFARCITIKCNHYSFWYSNRPNRACWEAHLHPFITTLSVSERLLASLLAQSPGSTLCSPCPRAELSVSFRSAVSQEASIPKPRLRWQTRSEWLGGTAFTLPVNRAGKYI